MIEKTRKVLTIILIVILVIAIVYSIVRLTMAAFEKPDLITSVDVPLYLVNGNLVKGYNTFYYVKSCLNNLIKGCEQGLYDEVYELYISDYKKQYTKEEVINKLKQLENNVEQIKELKNIYLVEEMYILELEINEQKQYLLMSIGSGKNSNYQFAFIK